MSPWRQRQLLYRDSKRKTASAVGRYGVRLALGAGKRSTLRAIVTCRRRRPVRTGTEGIPDRAFDVPRGWPHYRMHGGPCTRGDGARGRGAKRLLDRWAARRAPDRALGVAQRRRADRARRAFGRTA